MLSFDNYLLQNSFGIKAIAEKFFIAENHDDLDSLYSCYEQIHILGAGTNLLIVKNVSVALKLGENFQASRLLKKIANDWLHKGFSGLEFSVGIPGTLGGAIKMNAGGKHGTMSDIVQSITTWENHQFVEQVPSFGYRSSNAGLIINANLQPIAEKEPQQIQSRMSEILQERDISQPKALSAGCIFKNTEQFPAGFLIEHCGLKGRQKGKAKISTSHANFIVCEKNPDPQDIFALIQIVQEEVYKRTSINLELEIEIWPKNSSDS